MSSRIRSGGLLHAQIPPRWRAWSGLLYATARVVLARSRGLSSSPTIRLLLAWGLLLLGLVVQVVLLWVAGYLIDLSISLMELWAELAQKHLELTL